MQTQKSFSSIFSALCMTACRRRLISLSSSLLLLLAPTSHLAAQPREDPSEFVFDKFEIVTGTELRQTILTGFLLEREVADLVNVYIDATGNRQLNILAFNGRNWSLEISKTLEPDVLFVDVVNIAGRDRLISYQPGRLKWLNIDQESQQELLPATINFDVPHVEEIPHVDISHDVTGDGLDDLVVPNIDGFLVMVQQDEGEFSTGLKIGPAVDLSGIYGADGYRYDPWSVSRIHELDFNHDGRLDLAYWAGTHLNVHTQNEQGLFTDEFLTITTEVDIDSDNFYSLLTGDMQGRVLHSLSDLNGDGISDMVIFTLTGQDISNKRSSFEVYFGEPNEGNGTRFSNQTGISFESDNKIQLALTPVDFDNNSHSDLMITTIAAGYLERSFLRRLGRRLGGQSMSFGVMGDDIWLDLEFYRMQNGAFSSEPTTSRRVALDGVPSHTEPGWVALDIVLAGATHERRLSQQSWTRAFNMISKIGDINGDGNVDLLIGKNTPNGVDVFVGTESANLFSANALDIAATSVVDEGVSRRVAAPNDEEFTWLVDLNRDGKDDMIMHHRFSQRDAHGAPTQPLGTEPHRVSILIAN